MRNERKNFVKQCINCWVTAKIFCLEIGAIAFYKTRIGTAFYTIKIGIFLNIKTNTTTPLFIFENPNLEE